MAPELRRSRSSGSELVTTNQAGSAGGRWDRQSVAGHLQDYIKAAMMFVLVLCIGLAIGCGAHGYSIIDGLYWTIGCMTTAGGELEADSEMLQVLYILYMPTAAVAMLSIARTVVQATQRRAIFCTCPRD